MALGQAIHRGTWHGVDRFLALTPFMARRLEVAGVPTSRITIRPSWVDDPGQSMPGGRDFVFVGRLDEAKGVRLLLQAWGPNRDGRRLVIAGSGPLQEEVVAAARRDSSIVYRGEISRPDVMALVRTATAVILPSLWFEGFPLAMVEAFAVGRPVVVLEGGSAASVVDDTVGWRVARSHAALASLLNQWDERESARRGNAARLAYQAQYSAQVAMASLVDVYEVLANGSQRVRA